MSYNEGAYCAHCENPLDDLHFCVVEEGHNSAKSNRSMHFACTAELSRNGKLAGAKLKFNLRQTRGGLSHG